MSFVRTLTCTALLLTITAASPSFADTSGDTRARVDLSKSHTVVYPQGFEASDEQGVVTLDVAIGTDGMVSRVRVAQTSGHQDLDLAATESALNWRFIPAMRGGEISSDEIMLRVVYDRPDPAAPAPAH
jgi:TonB family protein